MIHLLKIDHFKKVFLFCALLISNFSVHAQNPDVMKAVALQKLSLFITWPEQTFSNNTANEFTIAVLNNEPFGKTIEKIYKNQHIKNKKVIVRQVKNSEELTDCHLLYISNSSEKELKKILSSLKNKPVLIVSNKNGFGLAGSHINLYDSNNKLRFEINQMALKEAGFTIEYQLLHVSKIINPITK
ncbi:MAG: YfiR family protein [Paludibacteraceae bacterium]|nr:YfiR family protein [Paludibacteraceae bacterium]MBN2786713.1 YfiR family protein [Paludibacteraceae bacterium]